MSDAPDMVRPLWYLGMKTEYITKEKAIEAACEGVDEWDEGFTSLYRDKKIAEYIHGIPSADVVEVVRCKNCIHSFEIVNGVFGCESSYGLESPVGGMDFCSNGLRRPETSHCDLPNLEGDKK